MYDERFDRDNAYCHHLRERRQKAESWLQATADEAQLAVLQGVVTSWWNGHYAGYIASPENERVARAGEELGKRLHQHECIPTELRRALENYFATRRDCSTFDMAAAILLGRMLGTAVAHTPGQDITAFENSVQLISDTVGEGLTDYVDAFTVELAGQPELTRAWLASLSQLPGSLGGMVEVIGRQEQAVAALERQQRTFLKTGNPYRLWREIQGDLPVEVSTYARFLIMKKVDFQQFIRAVGSIPSNEVRQSLLEYIDIPKDQEAVLQGVQLAPPVALAADQGNLVALHMVAAGVDYVVRLNAGFAVAARSVQDEGSQVRLAEEAAHFQVNEVPDWLHRLFTALLARADGMTIALEYGRYLLTLAQRADTPDWNPYLAALEALTTMIEKRGLDAQAIHAHWQTYYPNYAKNHPSLFSRGEKRLVMRIAHDDSPVPYLVIATSLDDVSVQAEPLQSPGGEAAAVPKLDPWLWYIDILVHGDEDISYHVNPFGGAAPWVFATIAQALVKQEDSVRLWNCAWSAIAFQRQFERFGSNTHDALAPSLHLLRTGRCAVAMLAEAGHQDRAQALWRLLLHATYQVSFGGTGTKGIVPANELGVLFASVRIAFGDHWAEALELAAPILNTHGDIAVMAAHLMIDSGLSAGEVAQAFARVGCNLQDECAILTRWQELGGFGRRDAEGLPISKLAEALARA